MKLRKVDRELINRFDITDDELLDVRRLRPKDWKPEAEDLGYEFVYVDD